MNALHATQPPVFLVVGPVGHGKSTVRQILADLTHLKGGSCSDVIYAFLAQRKGVSVDKLRQMPKEELRPALIEAGDFLCGKIESISELPFDASIDKEPYRIPSILIRVLYMNGYNVIDGVRRREELLHAIDRLEWIGVEHVVFHVSDPRKPLIADNSEDLKDLADFVVVNDGTIEELQAKILASLEQRFPKTAMPEVVP